MVVRVKGYPQSAVALRKGEGHWKISQEAPRKEELQMCDWKIQEYRLCPDVESLDKEEVRRAVRRPAQGGAVHQNG